jgi:3-hydroxy-3-methylglutaryl CoA synthase
MKSVFLIMYLWNAASRCDSGACAHAAGGPALQVVEMPSLAACESVGAAAKQMVDVSRPDPSLSRAWDKPMMSPPTAFRCVEVAR